MKTNQKPTATNAAASLPDVAERITRFADDLYRQPRQSPYGALARLKDDLDVAATALLQGAVAGGVPFELAEKRIGNLTSLLGRLVEWSWLRRGKGVPPILKQGAKESDESFREREADASLRLMKPAKNYLENAIGQACAEVARMALLTDDKEGKPEEVEPEEWISAAEAVRIAEGLGVSDLEHYHITRAVKGGEIDGREVQGKGRTKLEVREKTFLAWLAKNKLPSKNADGPDHSEQEQMMNEKIQRVQEKRRQQRPLD